LEGWYPIWSDHLVAEKRSLPETTSPSKIFTMKMATVVFAETLSIPESRSYTLKKT
jgi:hypothetical protein